MAAGSIGGLAALGKRGGSKLMEALAKKNEAAVAPEVARRLIERSLPKLVDAEGKLLLKRLNLDGFDPGQPALYDGVLAMSRAVDGS